MTPTDIYLRDRPLQHVRFHQFRNHWFIAKYLPNEKKFIVDLRKLTLGGTPDSITCYLGTDSFCMLSLAISRFPYPMFSEIYPYLEISIPVFAASGGVTIRKPQEIPLPDCSRSEFISESLRNYFVPRGADGNWFRRNWKIKNEFSRAPSVIIATHRDGRESLGIVWDQGEVSQFYGVSPKRTRTKWWTFSMFSSIEIFRP